MVMVEGASLLLRDLFLPSPPSFDDWCRPERAHEDGLADRLEYSTQLTRGEGARDGLLKSFEQSLVALQLIFVLLMETASHAPPTPAFLQYQLRRSRQLLALLSDLFFPAFSFSHGTGCGLCARACAA